MSGYLIADIEVTHPRRFHRYVLRVPAVVEQYGGRFLIRGGAHEVKEGDRSPRLLVVVEFPSLEDARRFYESEEYRPLRELRADSTRTDMVMVEGA